MRKLLVVLFVLTLTLMAVPAMADTYTFTVGGSGVSYSVSSGSVDYLSPTQIVEGSAGSLGSMLFAGGTGYSDSGLVLFDNGGLTLGNLQSVTVDTDNPANMRVNLWLDTGGDGQFFNVTNGILTVSGSGDSYCGTAGTAGSNTMSVDANSSIYNLGAGCGGLGVTLASLGLPADTPVALWVGITNPGAATITEVDVDTNGPITPEPASLFMFGSGLLGFLGVARRKLFNK